MQEKLHQAEARAARAEGLHSQEAQLRDRVSELELRLQSWESAAADLGLENPGDVSDKLREMQAECLALTEKLGDSTASAHRLQGKERTGKAKSQKKHVTLISGVHSGPSRHAKNCRVSQEWY